MATLRLPISLAGLPTNESFLIRAAGDAVSLDLDCGIDGTEYLVTDHLGDGGMGSVYKALAPNGNVVAVKLLRDGAPRHEVDRFIHEGKILEPLRHHPGILELRGYAEKSVIKTVAGRVLSKNNPYIVTEFLEGQSLHQLLREQMTIDDVADILLQVCDALNDAHALGIIHRDIKPENIFVCPPDADQPKWRIKILDFGIAKDTQQIDGLTSPGNVLGTPEFMSPEQCRGIGVGSKTDLYSLGVMAFWMVERCFPFPHTEDFMEVVAWHTVGERPKGMAKLERLIQIGRDEGKHEHSRALGDLKYLILKMIARDPRDRPLLNEVKECLVKVVQSGRRPRSRTQLLPLIQALTAPIRREARVVHPQAEAPTSPLADPRAVMSPAALAAAAAPAAIRIDSNAETLRQGAAVIGDLDAGDTEPSPPPVMRAGPDAVTAPRGHAVPVFTGRPKRRVRPVAGVPVQPVPSPAFVTPQPNAPQPTNDQYVRIQLAPAGKVQPRPWVRHVATLGLLLLIQFISDLWKDRRA